MGTSLVTDPVAGLRQGLERDGIVLLPGFVSGSRLASMQKAFRHALDRLRLNVSSPGYEKSERFRDMVEDVLTLDQGFVDLALDPDISQALREYIGPEYQLVEAKGWRSLPSRRDFHGWHGDEWYDQSKVTSGIPREVKVALYLTDVETGFFEYVKGTHQQIAPRGFRNDEIGRSVQGEILQARGVAGTAILFDTSGVHRQSVPILAEREAIFYNYHNPRIALQAADVKGNRYHPLLLNAAFLGGMTAERQRVLGFGDVTNYRAGHARAPVFPVLDRGYGALLHSSLRIADFTARVRARLRRIMGGKAGK